MGKTSKPLNIHLDKSLYDADKLAWDALAEQGFVLTLVDGEVVDIYFAPYAMRMTSDMLATMPAAKELAIKGARALRYAPHGKPLTKGKAIAKAKKSHKRKHVEEQTQTIIVGAPAVITGNSTTTEQVERVGGSTSYTVSEASHIE